MMHTILCCLINQIGDWTIRVDPPHGNQPYHRRHVHITKKGLKGQYSWNEDGSRHDKHRFPLSEQCVVAAKRHAAEALGINTADLRFITSVGGGVRVSIIAALGPHNKPLSIFNSYVRVDHALVIFGTDRGLAIVIEPTAHWLGES